MSCEGKWRAEVEQLQAATGIAPGSADAAPRCKQSDCRRPLKKDGSCPRGCPQDAAAPARAVLPPQTEALSCLIDTLDQQFQSLPPGPERTAFQTTATRARALLDRPPEQEAQATPQENEDTYLQLLDLTTRLRDLVAVDRTKQWATADELRQPWEADPRFRVARTAALDILLNRAETALAGSPDQADLDTAWHALLATLDHTRQDATLYRDQAERAQALLRRILPLESYAVGMALAHHLRVLTGFNLNVTPDMPTGFIFTPTGNSRRRGNTYNDDFSAPAWQALRSLGLVPWDDYQDHLTLPLEQARQLIQGHLTRIQGARQALDSAWQALEQHVLGARTLQPTPPPPETIGGWAERYAVPLWRACADAAAIQPTLRLLGDPTTTYTETRLVEGRKEAVALLRNTPPRLLPRVLAAFKFAPRVMDLLKFKAVREAVFTAEGPDLLTALPEIAPRAVAGLRLCEQVEALELHRRAAAKVHDLTPQDVADIAAASHALTDLLAPSAALPALQNLPTVATLVEALSQHVPPDRAPAKLAFSDAACYNGDSRLEQAQRTLSELWWHIGRDTELLPTDMLRKQAASHGMPYAHYATRDRIVGWFSAASSLQGQEAAIDATIQGAQGSRSTLRAVDRQGVDRTYKKGDSVRVDVDGTSHEGTVALCYLLPGKVNPRSHQVMELAPSVRVLLDDGADVTVPIAQVEFVSQRKVKKP